MTIPQINFPTQFKLPTQAPEKKSSALTNFLNSGALDKLLNTGVQLYNQVTGKNQPATASDINNLSDQQLLALMQAKGIAVPPAVAASVPKDNTMLYVGIVGGVLVLATIAFVATRPKKKDLSGTPKKKAKKRSTKKRK